MTQATLKESLSTFKMTKADLRKLILRNIHEFDIKRTNGKMFHLLFDLNSINMSDFLSWDTDLDLELLLGEYTEYDPSDSDSSIDFAVSSPKKKKTASPTAKVSDITYQCPVCDKTLKTISGFRGHTSKQHGQQLRASDFRVTNGVSATQSSTPTNCVSSQVSKDTFSKTFYSALPTSLCNIANDPFVVNPHEIKDLCQQLENNLSAKEYLNQVIYTIFEQSNSTLTQIIDRENLFRKLHKVRSDVSLRQKFLDHFPTSSEKVLSIFWQLIFEDIIGEIMSQMTKVQKHNSEKEQSQLTGNDQSILFYIAGYIVYSLRKRFSRYSVHKLGVISNFTIKSDSQNFVTKYSKWYNIQDRGGLQKPCDTLFLLVREMELIVRKTTSTVLSANSLLTEPLMENIMESFMIKYYCNILMANEEGSIVSAVTEDIIRLFLRIRGFAVTRLERNKTIKTSKSTKKSSSSLRQALKDITKN
ncbi:unnamed protein product [Mytilus edulis]|uniref:C2H2-type domain-containing protein n=1 Tax=Mytilus edulis TaxID=6550 RepID=A0A8S3UTY8_MYTED|nr:unnamed protein product [Mytilus edulis]